jgi:hypothetical protein
VRELEVKLYKNKVYSIRATYSADLNWKSDAEMAEAVSKAWNVPDVWTFGNISCKERSVQVLGQCGG